MLDAKLEMSDGQSLAIANDATVASTNVIDLGAADPNIGYGEPIWAHVRIGTAVTATTGGNLEVTVQDSPDNSSWSSVISHTAASWSDFTAGLKVVEQPLPVEVQRYLRVAYAVTGTAFSGGTVDAWLDLGPQTQL